MDKLLNIYNINSGLYHTWASMQLALISIEFSSYQAGAAYVKDQLRAAAS